ncbi:MAG: hypothetical protein ACJ71Q_06145 [Terriglobales bacterium]
MNDVNMADRLPNRWAIAFAAVVMQICLGAVYGWSVFKIPLIRNMGWKETDVQLNFTLAIVFLGGGTVIGGLWQDRVVRVKWLTSLECSMGWDTWLRMPKSSIAHYHVSRLFL